MFFVGFSSMLRVIIKGIDISKVKHIEEMIIVGHFLSNENVQTFDHLFYCGVTCHRSVQHQSWEM